MRRSRNAKRGSSADGTISLRAVLFQPPPALSPTRAEPRDAVSIAGRYARPANGCDGRVSPRSSGDRASPSGGVCAGSNPAEGASPGRRRGALQIGPTWSINEGVNGYNVLHAFIIGWGLGVLALAASGVAWLTEARADKRSR